MEKVTITRKGSAKSFDAVKVFNEQTKLVKEAEEKRKLMERLTKN